MQVLKALGVLFVAAVAAVGWIKISVLFWKHCPAGVALMEWLFR